MSFWIYRKDKDGRPFVYSVTVPFETILIALGLIACFLAPRCMHNSMQVFKDAWVLTLIGFSLFVLSKLSLFRQRIWNSWGTRQMSKPFKWLYRMGYTFMTIGLLGILFVSI
jgi:hypothetical protein